jgi:hypothetical protein
MLCPGLDYISYIVRDPGIGGATEENGEVNDPTGIENKE